MRGGLKSAGSAGSVRRRTALWLAASLVALSAMVTWPAWSKAADPAPPLPSGLLGVTPSAAASDLDMQRMMEAGATTIRHGLSWNAMQPRADRPISFTKSDEFMATASGMGLSVDLLLSGTPTWARSSAEATQWEPPLSSQLARDGWKQFVQAVAERYGHDGTFWQEHPELTYRPVAWTIWNEPNLDGFWDGPNSPPDFARLVDISGSVLHQADPGGTVVVGGVFCGFRWKLFVERFYDFVHKQNFDAVAFHPYAESPYHAYELMLNGRELMDQAGDAGTPYWIDEISWGTEVGRHRFTGTPAQQASKMRIIFQILAYRLDRLRLGKLLWYGIRDDPTANVCQFCASSGLWKTGGQTPKPAWFVFKDFGSGAAGTIQGRVKRAGAGPLARQAVFVDLNGNGSRDRGEPSTVTNTEGSYAFRNLVAARHEVRVDPRSGLTCRRPRGCTRNVDVEPGASVDGLTFVLRSR